jgi:hypothetical protein
MREFSATETPQLIRRQSIPSQKTVQATRSCVARSAGIKHHHTPPTATKQKRRVQTRRSPSDDTDVVHHVIDRE